MNKLLLFILLIGLGEAYAAPNLPEKKSIGKLEYYVLPEEKLILVEIPPRAEVSIVSIDSNSSMVNANIRRQTNFDRSEIRTLKEQYLGYSISSLDDLARVRSARLTLPNGRDVPLAVAHSSEVIIDGMVIIDNAEHEDLKKQLKKGNLPSIELVLRRSIPILVEVENISVPLGEICESSRVSLPQETTAGKAISKIAVKMKELMSRAMKISSAETIVERALNECLEIRKWSEPQEVSNLLELPVRLNAMSRQYKFNFVRTQRETIAREQASPIELKLEGEL